MQTMIIFPSVGKIVPYYFFGCGNRNHNIILKLNKAGSVEMA